MPTPQNQATTPPAGDQVTPGQAVTQGPTPEQDLATFNTGLQQAAGAEPIGPQPTDTPEQHATHAKEMLERNAADQKAQDEQQQGLGGRLAETAGYTASAVPRLAALEGVNILNSVGEHAYGIARTAANAVGLWRGAHGRFVTQGEVKTENPMQIDQQWATRMFGQPKNRGEQIAMGLMPLIPALMVGGGAGGLKGLLKGSATLAVLSPESEPGLAAWGLGKIPTIGNKLSAMLTPRDDQPYLEGEARHLVDSFITQATLDGAMAGVRKLVGTIRGTAPKAQPERVKPSLQAQLLPGAQGGVDVAMVPQGTASEPPPMPNAAPTPGTLEQGVAANEAAKTNDAAPQVLEGQAVTGEEKPANSPRLLTRTASREVQGTMAHQYSFEHEGQPFGLDVQEAEGGKTLNVSRVGPVDAEGHPIAKELGEGAQPGEEQEGANKLGLRKVLQGAQELAGDFPNAQRVVGLRATGARAGKNMLEELDLNAIRQRSVNVPNITDAESLGASLEHATLAHEVADQAEAGTLRLNDHQQEGIRRLGTLMSSTRNPAASDLHDIIGAHDLTSAIPYLTGDLSHASDMITQIRDVLRGVPVGPEAEAEIATTLHPEANTVEDAIGSLRQAGENTQEAFELKRAAQVYARIHWNLVGKLSEAADLNPGNAIAQNNFISALEHGMHVYDGIDDILRGGGRIIGSESNFGQAIPGSTRGTAQLGPATPNMGFQPGIAGYMRDVRGLPPNAPIDPADYQALVRQANINSDDPASVYRTVRNFQRLAQAKAAAKGATNVIPFGTKEWALAIPKLIPAQFLANVISGAKTIERVAIGNLANFAKRPLSMYWSAMPGGGPEALGMGGFRGWDPGLIQRGNDFSVQAVKHVGDALDMAWKAGKAGHSLLDPSIGGFKPAEQIQGLSWLQTIQSVPGRFHLTESEFTRALAYHGEVASQSIAQSMRLNLPAAEVAKRLEADIAMSVSPEGAAVNARALDEANRIANTRTLSNNRLLRAMTQYRNDNSLAYMMQPVMKYAANAYTNTMEELPILGNFQKGIQDDFAAGGERARIAQARMEMATMTTAGIMALVHNNLITGSGPLDPQMYKEWSVNHKPYSIKLPDGEWHSYDIFGALSGTAKISTELLQGLKGIAAHEAESERIQNFAGLHPATHIWGRIADVFGVTGHISESVGSNAFNTLAAALAHGFGDMHWLHDTVENTAALMKGDTETVKKWLRNATTSLMVPRIVQDMNWDPIKREVDSQWDAIKASVPGMSKSLEPEYNAWGEPTMYTPGYSSMPNYKLNVFAGMKGNNDELTDKLLQLGKRVSHPYPVLNPGLGDLRIDLKDRTKWGEDTREGISPWARWHQLVNTELQGNRTLRESVEDLVQTERFQKAERNDGLINPTSRAVAMVQERHDEYYAKAWKQVMREYPRLQKAIYGEKAIQRAIKSGRGDAENAAILKVLEGLER